MCVCVYAYNFIVCMIFPLLCLDIGYPPFCIMLNNVKFMSDCSLFHIEFCLQNNTIFNSDCHHK